MSKIDVRKGIVVDSVDVLCGGTRMVSIRATNAVDFNGTRTKAKNRRPKRILSAGVRLLACGTLIGAAAAFWPGADDAHKSPAEHVQMPVSAPAVVPVEKPEAMPAPDTVKAPRYIEAVPLSEEEQAALFAAADEFGVEYALMLGLIERETNFRNIPGDGGDSAGFCQIQSKWWGGLMEEIGADDLTDPADNFRTACAIVANLIERYGSTRDALTAYNAGKPGESQYSRAVLANAEKWAALLEGQKEKAPAAVGAADERTEKISTTSITDSGRIAR